MSLRSKMALLDVEVPWKELVPGQEYRFECRGRPSRTGRFLTRYVGAVGPRIDFNNVSGENSDTIVGVQGNQCRFFESEYTKHLAMVSNAKNVAPNIERLLRKYGGKRRRSVKRKSKARRTRRARRAH